MFNLLSKKPHNASTDNIPACNCIKILPREPDRVVKDPCLDDSLYSATCESTKDCPSNIVTIADTASTRT
jgi:hypothetical protein